jgi:biopolymer transport protein ExbD
MRMIAVGSMLALVSIVGLAQPSSAEELKYNVDLTGANETPPNDSKAAGKITVSVDTETKKVTWQITSDNLSGEATAAHFHGPAAEGQKADPVVDLSSNIKSGNGSLTEEQLKMLQDGKMYVNVHTAKYPDGEIRGQLKK